MVSLTNITYLEFGYNSSWKQKRVNKQNPHTIHNLEQNATIFCFIKLIDYTGLKSLALLTSVAKFIRHEFLL